MQTTLQRIDPTKFTFLYFLVGGLFVSFKHDLIYFLPANIYLPKSTNLFIDFSILIASAAIFHILLINLKNYNQVKAINNKQFLKNKLAYLGWGFVILLLIPLVNLGIYQHQVPKVELSTYDNLQAIASIKVQQLKSWLDYRLADGDILASDTQFADEVVHFIKHQDKLSADTIKSRFNVLLNSYHYESVALIANNGNSILQTGANNDFNTQVDQALIEAVRSDNKTHHSDFFVDKKNELNLQILAPIIIQKSTMPVAYVLIQTGFYRPILPSLQMWPSSQNTTADSMLIKHHHDEVIIADATPDDFNGEGIHYLKLAENNLYDPKQILSDGKNLIGKMAYSASLPIAGTTWYFLTEITQDEVMTGLYQLLLWTGVAALIALGIISSMLFLLWKQQKSAYKLALELKDVELHKLLDKFHTMPFIGTGTLNALDLKWLEVNPRLTEIFGYSEKELADLQYTDLNYPGETLIDEAYDAKFKKGEINHYTREKRFTHKTGKLIYARVEVSAIRNDYYDVKTYVIAVEDITERIIAEQALKISEERLELVVRGSNDGWWDLDLINNVAHHSKR